MKSFLDFELHTCVDKHVKLEFLMTVFSICSVQVITKHIIIIISTRCDLVASNEEVFRAIEYDRVTQHC